MITQKENYFWFKLNGLSRWGLAHGLMSWAFPVYVVNEYPKSGGTWIGQMLAEALDIPFPRNRLPIINASLIHGHFMNDWNIQNPLILYRDGRDVLISQYYHYLFYNDAHNKTIVDKTRRNISIENYDDINSGLPIFIEYIYNSKFERFSWSDFVNKWYDNPHIVNTTYEAMRLDTATELKKIVYAVSDNKITLQRAEEIALKFSFKKQSGRKEGEEKTNSFMRKGIIGDWKQHFSKESKDLFKKYAGQELIKLGYEKDLTW